jgi:AP-1 complex subunit beta-1
MDDLMGLFGDTGGGGKTSSAPLTNDDLMNGFAGLDVSGSSQPPPPAQQLEGQKMQKSNQDLLDLF